MGNITRVKGIPSRVHNQNNSRYSILKRGECTVHEYVRVGEGKIQTRCIRVGYIIYGKQSKYISKHASRTMPPYQEAFVWLLS